MSFYFANFFDKYKQFLKHDYKDYSFNVDLEYGKLYFTRKLFALPGKHLQLDLSLKYIEPHTASTGYNLSRVINDLIVGGWGNDFKKG